MYFVLLNLAFIASILAAATEAAASTAFPPCAYGDANCVKAAISLALKTFPSGNSSIGLRPLDPLHINGAITIERGVDSPVNLKFDFTENDVIGFSDHECISVRGFQQNPIGDYEIVLKGPKLSLVGSYDVTGKALLLPIQGDGWSNITTLNTVVTLKFTGQTKVKSDGKQYLFTDNLKLSFTTTRLITDLRNLFGGNQILSKTASTLLDLNWRLVFAELQESAFESLGQVYQGVINEFLDKNAYADLFI